MESLFSKKSMGLAGVGNLFKKRTVFGEAVSGDDDRPINITKNVFFNDYFTGVALGGDWATNNAGDGSVNVANNVCNLSTGAAAFSRAMISLNKTLNCDDTFTTEFSFQMKCDAGDATYTTIGFLSGAMTIYFIGNSDTEIKCEVTDGIKVTTITHPIDLTNYQTYKFRLSNERMEFLINNNIVATVLRNTATYTVPIKSLSFRAICQNAGAGGDKDCYLKTIEWNYQ